MKYCFRGGSMDKKTFYSELTVRLNNLGMRPEYIDKHIAQFDKYFADKTSEQVSEEIESLGDLDVVAAKIKRATDKMLLAESGIPTDDDVKIHTEVNEPIREEEPAPDNFATESVSEETDDMYRPVQIREDIPDEFEEEKPIKVKGDTPSKHLKAANIDDEELKERLLWFRVAFFCCIPVMLAVILATALFFGAIYFVIALIIIGAVALLAGITVAGAGISVFGIILGIVRLMSCMPIGLYECGLSIMIGSAALFAGILVYNFAVRLMPWIGSMLLKFIKFVFKKYRMFYIYIKKECLKL